MTWVGGALSGDRGAPTGRGDSEGARGPRGEAVEAGWGKGPQRRRRLADEDTGSGTGGGGGRRRHAVEFGGAERSSGEVWWSGTVGVGCYAVAR